METSWDRKAKQKTRKNADLFKNIIIWLQKLLNITVNTYTVDCNTAKTKRADFITKFKLDSDISLMLNIQILNEGIDIPICDSVFITDPNNNIENLIQYEWYQNVLILDILINRIFFQVYTYYHNHCLCLTFYDNLTLMFMLSCYI